MSRPPFTLHPLSVCVVLALSAPAASQAAVPSNLEYDNQAALATINVRPAWQLGFDGSGVVVAIVDSGVDATHSELSETQVVGGYDLRNEREYTDDASHRNVDEDGSHLAGLIAAKSDGVGMVGVAYGAKVMDFPYLDQPLFDPRVKTWLAQTITYGISKGVKIYNNSWILPDAAKITAYQSAAAVTADQPDVVNMGAIADANDALLVWETGNSDDDQPSLAAGLPYFFPEYTDNWLAVGGTNLNGSKIAAYSNPCGVAKDWCLVAPGGEYEGADGNNVGGVYSIRANSANGYLRNSGTGQAAAQVSGVVALVRQAFPWMTMAQVRDTVLTTATEMGVPGVDDVYGWGMVNAGKAVLGLTQFITDFNADLQTDTLLGNSISGTGGLIKLGAGTLRLTASNNYQGRTEVREGTLLINSNNALGNLGSQLILDGGTLGALSGGLDVKRALVLGAGGGVFNTAGFQNQQLSGVISGAGDLRITGGGSVALGAGNTFTGDLLLDQVTVRAVDDTSFGQSGGSVKMMNNAALELRANTQLNRAIEMSQGGATIKGAAPTGLARIDLAGQISGDGKLSLGQGDFHLLADNTYTGGTSVSSGSLTLKSAATLGGGTLSLQDAQLHLTAAQELDNDVKLASAFITVDTHGFDSVLNGVISGTGSLVKAGAGDLELTGINTYEGGTFINGGTLTVSEDANLGKAGTAVIATGGKLIMRNNFETSRMLILAQQSLNFNTVTDVSLSGALTGSGGLLKTGAGTLNLTGSSTYTGGTVVEEGTLRIASNSALGNPAGKLTINGGTLDTAGSFNLSREVILGSEGGVINIHDFNVLLGPVTGSGGLVKTGGGTLTLSADGTYQGATLIQGGTLALRTAGALGQTSSLTLDNATLNLDAGMTLNRNIVISAQGASVNTGDHASTLDGVISGAGSLRKLGQGELTLTGANTYGGDTLLSEGSLAISDDAALGSSGSILHAQGGALRMTAALDSNRTIAIDASELRLRTEDATRLGGTISGGSLIKDGTGTLTLDGVSTVSRLQVNEGRVVVNNRVNGAVNIGAGTTLAGSGVINGLTTVAGTLAPGNSPGVLTFTGSVALDSTANTVIEIDGPVAGAGAGKHDQIVVTGGTFAANGVLQPVLRGISAPATNTYTPAVGQTFTVITADSVISRFTSMVQPTDGLAGKRLDVIYTPTTVNLLVTPARYADLAAVGGAGTANRNAIGQALDNLRPASGATLSGEAGRLFAALMPLSPTALGQTFDQLSPAPYAEALESRLSTALVRYTALQDLRDNTAGTFSVRLVLDDSSVDSDGNGPAADRTRSGVRMTLVGEPHDQSAWQPLIGLGFGHDKVDLDSAAIKSDDVSLSLGGYRASGNWRTVIQADVSRYDLDADRTAMLVGTRYHATARAKSNMAAGVGVSVARMLGETLQLSGGLRYDIVNQKEIAEQGAGFVGLTVEKESRERGSANLGLAWTGATMQAKGWAWQPLVQLQAEHFFNADPATVKTRLAGQPIISAAAETGDLALRGSIGIAAGNSEGLVLSVKATGEQRDNLSAAGVQLGVQKAF